jgi:hypothetical protein
MSHTWQKTPRRTTLPMIQRIQILMLRLERLAVAKQVQRTQAVIRAFAPVEERKNDE